MKINDELNEDTVNKANIIIKEYNFNLIWYEDNDEFYLTHKIFKSKIINLNDKIFFKLDVFYKIFLKIDCKNTDVYKIFNEMQEFVQNIKIEKIM